MTVSDHICQLLNEAGRPLNHFELHARLLRDLRPGGRRVLFNEFQESFRWLLKGGRLRLAKQHPGGEAFHEYTTV